MRFILPSSLCQHNDIAHSWNRRRLYDLVAGAVKKKVSQLAAKSQLAKNYVRIKATLSETL